MRVNLRRPLRRRLLQQQVDQFPRLSLFGRKPWAKRSYSCSWRWQCPAKKPNRKSKSDEATMCGCSWHWVKANRTSSINWVESLGRSTLTLCFFSRTDDKPESSALVDLLDISFGAAGISSPHQQPGPSTSVDPWGVPVAGGSRPQVGVFEWVFCTKSDKLKFTLSRWIFRISNSNQQRYVLVQ